MKRGAEFARGFRWRKGIFSVGEGGVDCFFAGKRKEVQRFFGCIGGFLQFLPSMSTILSPARTVAELKELRSLTGDENGAQRVAFTPVWVKAREWLRGKLGAIPVEVHSDAAGN